MEIFHVGGREIGVRLCGMKTEFLRCIYREEDEWFVILGSLVSRPNFFKNLDVL